MRKSALILCLCLTAQGAPADAASPSAIPVDLDLAHLQHVTFPGLAPTAYANMGAALVADVRSSSSFLLAAFEKPVVAHGLRFDWKTVGTINVKDAAAESSKDGDDAVLRLGILVAGEPPMIPFLAPVWVKSVRDVLKAPANRMFFVEVGTKHPEGSRWPDPYNDDIMIFSAKNTVGSAGCRQAEITFDASLAVVGLWIMADGDNTKSSFQTTLKAVEFFP